ncbi:MAG: hypothetical protein ACP5VS_14365, partial [Desulfomonilaceae bacterium]
MKFKQNGLSGSATPAFGPKFRRQSSMAKKAVWLIGLFILWAVVFLGIQYFLSAPQHWAVARIEILGTHDRFDPRIWFQDNAHLPITSNVREHAEALKSRELAQSVIADLTPERFKELRLAIADKTSKAYAVANDFTPLGPLRSISTNAGAHQPIDYICENIAIEPVAGCDMIDISLRAPNQSLATELLSLYLREFNWANLEKRRMQAMESVKNLKQGLRETELELKEAEALLLDFVIENGFCATVESGLGQVFNIINKHIGSDKQFESLKHFADTKSNEQWTVSKDSEREKLIDRMVMDLEKLETDQSELASTLGFNHPKMMALTGKIAFLRDRICYLGRGVYSDLQKKSTNYLTKARSLEEQYSQLKLELDTKRDFHRMLQKASHEWSV